MIGRLLSYGLGMALAMTVLVSAVGASVQTVSGKLTITGSGTRWVLTLDNGAGSTGAIKCWRYTFPPGVQATAIGSPPAGWTLGGNRPPPAPILGGRSTTGLAPGARAAFPIVTDRAFDTSGPAGTAAISEDCVADQSAPVAFGSAPAPLRKCLCRSLDVDELDASLRATKMKLEIEWTLRCRKGSGSCEGLLQIVPPKKKFAFQLTRKTDVCRGPCGRKTNGQTLATIPYPKGAPDRFAGETFRFTFRKFCRVGNAYRPAGAQTATVVVNEKGRVDRVASDLDANGVPDGDE
jgi:hypothetical protein